MNIIKSIFKSRDRPRLHGRAVQRQRNDQPKNHTGDSIGGGRSFPFGRAWSGKSVTERTAIHNPSMMLYGQASELEQGIDFLNEVKESIINAYQIKTGLSRSKISHLMDGETWMNAHSAHDMGFCDRILYSDDEKQEISDMVFDKTAMVTNTIAAMRKKLKPIEKPEDKTEDGVPAEQFETRLNLLK